MHSTCYQIRNNATNMLLKICLAERSQFSLLYLRAYQPAIGANPYILVKSGAVTTGFVAKRPGGHFN